MVDTREIWQAPLLRTIEKLERGLADKQKESATLRAELADVRAILLGGKSLGEHEWPTPAEATLRSVAQTIVMRLDDTANELADVRAAVEALVSAIGQIDDDDRMWMVQRGKKVDDAIAAARADAPRCSICRRLWNDQPGSTHCTAQHGECAICKTPRAQCKCLTTPLAAAPERRGRCIDANVPQHVRIDSACPGCPTCGKERREKEDGDGE